MLTVNVQFSSGIFRTLSSPLISDAFLSRMNLIDSRIWHRKWLSSHGILLFFSVLLLHTILTFLVAVGNVHGPFKGELVDTISFQNERPPLFLVFACFFRILTSWWTDIKRMGHIERKRKFYDLTGVSFLVAGDLPSLSRSWRFCSSFLCPLYDAVCGYLIFVGYNFFLNISCFWSPWMMPLVMFLAIVQWGHSLWTSSLLWAELQRSLIVSSLIFFLFRRNDLEFFILCQNYPLRAELCTWAASKATGLLPLVC